MIFFLFSLISFTLFAEDIETVAVVQGLCFPFTSLCFVHVNCFSFDLLRACIIQDVVYRHIEVFLQGP